VVGEEALEVFRYAAEHTLPPVRPVAVERLLRQAIEQVFENREVEDALAEAQEQALSLPAPRVTEPVAVPSPVPPEATVETITFVTSRRQEYVPLAEAFHEFHPDIKVIVREAVDFDYHGMWPTEMLKASDADCFWSTCSATMPELRQVALNLQLFADADPTLSLDDYLPWALEWVRYGGNLWGLPAGVNVEVLWYNRTLFDEAGLPYPENDWSWDDVFLIARKLAGRDKGGQYYGFIIPCDARIIHVFEAIGGPLVDESPAPPTFRFDAPKAVAAAQQLRSLVQDEVIPIPEQSKEYPGQNLYTLIWANRVGMWAEPAQGYQALDFHPAPLPQPSRCQRSWVSSAYYIAADTPHAEACWEWLRFLSERIPDTSTLPPRHSLLTSDAFSEQVGEDAQAVYLEALECKDWIRFRGRESLPRYAEGALYTWLRQALGEILWQGADAQATLSEAQQQAEAYLDCLRQRPDQEDWETADACLQELDAP